jgi:prolipoprotein diacylglyceryltransferase
VPLGGAHFPLLPAHARTQLVNKEDNVPYGYLQTSTGFTIRKSDASDPRSVVQTVEPGSAAEKAGIKAGDKIVKVNGVPNFIVVEVLGKPDSVTAALTALGKYGGESRVATEEHTARSYFTDPEMFKSAYPKSREELGRDEAGVSFNVMDYLWEQVREWPRGREDIELDVERDGEVKAMKFEPRTIGLYPTQLYETVSMVLLILVLLAFHPLRRHDGQVMVLLMLGYALHRFINESIRVEPTYAMGLTLSQWGSVVILLAAVGLEILLWRIMPSRWATQPLAASQVAAR